MKSRENIRNIFRFIWNLWYCHLIRDFPFMEFEYFYTPVYGTYSGIPSTCRTLIQKGFNQYAWNFGELFISIDVNSLSFINYFGYTVSEFLGFYSLKMGWFSSFRTITQKQFHQFASNFRIVYIYWSELPFVFYKFQIYRFQIWRFYSLKRGNFPVFRQ